MAIIERLRPEKSASTSSKTEGRTNPSTRGRSPLRTTTNSDDEVINEKKLDSYEAPHMRSLGHYAADNINPEPKGILVTWLRNHIDAEKHAGSPLLVRARRLRPLLGSPQIPLPILWPWQSNEDEEENDEGLPSTGSNILFCEGDSPVSPIRFQAAILQHSAILLDLVDVLGVELMRRRRVSTFQRIRDRPSAHFFDLRFGDGLHHAVKFNSHPYDFLDQSPA
ncbi:hypothetical protein BDK51DRAFT_37916 [Blyttiomyces helicus]|uniref:Uncharacterized protein n=1 Tax=Blyttiomyces helicus TaxID=388810 RepID=A0A4V1IQ57_9FUNG|nr:hypothetical protein BDK51DRAFT_37916 [Blyttiomyces helicus]|eukprot:RKO85397.1 hypothetical protein BDK51DRAFT_37916 [Blyttiomyces helicus]